MAQTATAPEIPVPRLKVHYSTELRQRLQQELGLRNIMQVPRPVKIVINMGVGDAIREPRQLDGAVRDLTAITGQKPQVTKAKQSIAGFKIREGQSIGAEACAQFRGCCARRVNGFELRAQLLDPLPAGFDPRVLRLQIAGGCLDAGETLGQRVDVGATA